jgi:ABC-type transport system involved in multi-copper enzyme maturation permease subunit
MTGRLVRSELRKVVSTRLWWGLLIGAVCYTAIQAGASAALAGVVPPGGGQPATPGLDSPEVLRGIYAGSMVTGTYVFALILGITGMTGEYRYQTVTSTFLASPRRSRVVVAKMLAHLVMGVVYGVVALVASFVVGVGVVAVRGHALGLGDLALWRAAALGVLAVALWTVLGIGIGTLIRNQVAAILIAVFITFLLAPLVSLGLSAVDLDWLARWLPTNASAALTSPVATQFTSYLDWWAGGLVLLGYALAFAALGVGLSLRRDIT